MDPDETRRVRHMTDQLAELGLEGPSRGGPYVGVVHNDLTRAIVDVGEEAIPLLLEALDHSTYTQAVHIVFCLRELRASGAVARIRELRDANQFEGVEHDMTLDMQIRYFLRDLES